MRKTIAALSLVLGGIVILVGYLSVPSQSACDALSGISQCSATPATGYFALAGVFGLVGFVLVVADLLRVTAR